MISSNGKQHLHASPFPLSRGRALLLDKDKILMSMDNIPCQCSMAYRQNLLRELASPPVDN